MTDPMRDVGNAADDAADKRLLKEAREPRSLLALFTTYYNFVKVHSKLRISPAMAAGVADRLWEIADIVRLVEDAEAKTGQAGAVPEEKRGARGR